MWGSLELAEQTNSWQWKFSLGVSQIRESAGPRAQAAPSLEQGEVSVLLVQAGSVWEQPGLAWLCPQGTQKCLSRGTGQVGTSSPAMLCSMGSGAVAKGVCRSYHPGEQETFCPGRGEPQVHAYLPRLSEEDRALDGKNPFIAVPVPWSLHSAVSLCCLHTSFCAESKAAEQPTPSPRCPACTVLGAGDRA